MGKIVNHEKQKTCRKLRNSRFLYLIQNRILHKTQKFDFLNDCQSPKTIQPKQNFS